VSFCKGKRIKALDGGWGKESKVPEEYTPLAKSDSVGIYWQKSKDYHRKL